MGFLTLFGGSILRRVVPQDVNINRVHNHLPEPFEEVHVGVLPVVGVNHVAVLIVGHVVLHVLNRINYRAGLGNRSVFEVNQRLDNLVDG